MTMVKKQVGTGLLSPNKMAAGHCQAGHVTGKSIPESENNSVYNSVFSNIEVRVIGTVSVIN